MLYVYFTAFIFDTKYIHLITLMYFYFRLYFVIVLIVLMQRI